MIHYEPPESWDTPEWHSDFGDAKGELEHLRMLAQLLRDRLPLLSVGLDVPEPGLMYLIASKGEQPLAEVYSVSDRGGNEHRRYGVFLSPSHTSCEEIYIDSGTAVVDLLRSL